MKILYLPKPLGIVLLCILISTCTNAPKIPKEKTKIQLALVASGIAGPVSADAPKDGSGRLFICEQTGKIRIVKEGQLLAVPFLDINTKLDVINKQYSEKGLLGLAFHPNYKSNGKFYVYYSGKGNHKNNDHKSIVAEFTVSENSDVANVNSEKVILEIQQPEENHNGGQLAFGADGYLYIASGDGGGANDEHGGVGNGQNLKTWLGKILRIDVNADSAYNVPKDNPFVNNPNALPQIWAYGLRNPWRFSFDRKSGLLFCADVGQNKWEEIDIIEKGKNYGWRIMEASNCFNPSKNCDTKDLVLPIAEYSHQEGVCVTGGYVYNGIAIDELKGQYIFADWTGQIYTLQQQGKEWKMKGIEIADEAGKIFKENVNSFGEDEAGEIYILCQKSTGPYELNGSVYKIVKQ